LKRLGVAHRTALIGVVTRGMEPIALLSSTIAVDALDATHKAIDIVDRAKALYPLEAVFLDGVTYAGFNIVDPQRLHALTGTNVIVVLRYSIDLGKVLAALKNHFTDWRLRYRVISTTYENSFPIHFPNGTSIRVSCIGVPRVTCERYVREVTLWMPNPEPLRLADLIASAIGRKIFERTIKHVVDDEYTPFPRSARR